MNKFNNLKISSYIFQSGGFNNSVIYLSHCLNSIPIEFISLTIFHLWRSTLSIDALLCSFFLGANV
jgi:hypothetical protein